jgi:hypothetical protein
MLGIAGFFFTKNKIFVHKAPEFKKLASRLKLDISSVCNIIQIWYGF